MPAKRIDLADRFNAKYAKAESGCWLWTAAKDKDGYGGIQANGEKVRAHRVSWQLANGPVPDGLCVLHRCDTPSCVNPEHLFLGSNAENIADKIAKNRMRVGSRHGMAKLTESDVAAIRSIEGVTAQKIADTFGVSKSLIGHIRAGDLWRSVQ